MTIDPQPRELLEHDHARLEILFDALMEAFHADARDDVRKIWTELEQTLLTHMETEERWVLPEFARVDPGEAVALLEEHGTIRARLSDLGNGVDLHAIPESVAAAFIAALRAHARRESALFYRWVQGRQEPARERLL